MNQPIEDRIKRLEDGQKRLEEEVKKLREQRTEEIKAVRVEVASEDVINRLKTVEKGQEEIKEDTNVIKIQMQGARADILSIKATQSDHGEFFKENRQIQHHHAEKLDQHTEVLGQLVSFAESHDALLKDMKATQAEQGTKLDLILKLLQNGQQ